MCRALKDMKDPTEQDLKQFDSNMLKSCQRVREFLIALLSHTHTHTHTNTKTGTHRKNITTNTRHNKQQHRSTT